MKKFISGVLAILMVVSLTACGGEEFIQLNRCYKTIKH